MIDVKEFSLRQVRNVTPAFLKKLADLVNVVCILLLSLTLKQKILFHLFFIILLGRVPDSFEWDPHRL